MSKPRYTLHLGDCLDVLRTLEAGSVDAVVTDPPAGISFMGKGWDSFGGRCNANAEADRDAANRGPGAGLGNQPFGYSGSALPSRRERDGFIAFLSVRLAECLRVAKPGAVLLCWAIPRTSHWTGTAIEDAGWQIEDRITHLFGTGFPKHKSKLKPGAEDWWLARKPGPKWLGVDAGRIPAGDGVPKFSRRAEPAANTYADGLNGSNRTGEIDTATGRWPANVALSHHPECNGHCHADCPVRLLDEQSGDGGSKTRRITTAKGTMNAWRRLEQRDDIPPTDERSLVRSIGDTGGASRFFYCAKASRRDRNEGLEGMPESIQQSVALGDRQYGTLPYTNEPREIKPRPRANHHPTVKSTDLMRWLCRLACPPGGVVLDPFTGSGSTGKAAILEGFEFIGCEKEPDYYVLSDRRLADAASSMPLFAGIEA